MKSNSASPQPSQRQRDLLPLGRVVSDGRPPRVGLSRGVRQRIAKREFWCDKVNAVVDVVNEIYSGAEKGAQCSQNRDQSNFVPAGHVAAHRLLRARLEQVPKPPVTYSPHEASRALLGATRLSYDDDEADSSVRSYDRALVSIPSAGSDASLAGSLLDPDAATVVDQFESHMLLPPAEYDLASQQFEPITPYMDETLGSDREKYNTFLRDMYDANLIDFTCEPIDICTPFFRS